MGFKIKRILELRCETVNGEERNCEHELITEKNECDSGIPCPTNYIWGKWSDWSQCSKTCLEHPNENSIQERVRTCSPPDCSSGNREFKPCTVGICPIKCPPYHLVTINNYKGEQMQADFRIDRANVIVGKFVR